MKCATATRRLCLGSAWVEHQCHQDLSDIVLMQYCNLLLQGKDPGHATAIQDITRHLAELVYGGRRGVRHKGWAPADAETIRCGHAVGGYTPTSLCSSQDPIAYRLPICCGTGHT